MNPTEQLLLAKMFGDDKKSIPYRPRIAKVVGSITAAILLQQVVYRWNGNGQKAFYKFKSPCPHTLYQEDDSWTEELGFSKAEFDCAIKKIGIKKRGDNTTHDEYLAECREQQKPVFYWITAGRVTYYNIILDVLVQILAKAYDISLTLNQQSESTKINKVDLLVNQESGFIRSEKENTSEKSPTGDIEIPLKQEQEQEPPGLDNSHLDVHVWDLEESPGTEHECPSCDGTYSLGDLKGSRAACPHCKRSVRVVAGDNVMKKAARPQGKVAGGMSDWKDSVEAFCRLAPTIDYKFVSFKMRQQWANIIAGVAGNADPGHVAGLIPKLDVWNVDGLTTPRMTRFQEALTIALATGDDPDNIDMNAPTGDGGNISW